MNSGNKEFSTTPISTYQSFPAYFALKIYIHIIGTQLSSKSEFSQQLLPYQHYVAADNGCK